MWLSHRACLRWQTVTTWRAPSVANGVLGSKWRVPTSNPRCLTRTRPALCKLTLKKDKELRLLNFIYQSHYIWNALFLMWQEAGTSVCESRGQVAGGVWWVLEPAGLRGAGPRGELEGLGEHRRGPHHQPTSPPGQVRVFGFLLLVKIVQECQDN